MLPSPLRTADGSIAGARPRLASLIQACAYQAAVALNAPMLPAANGRLKSKLFESFVDAHQEFERASEGHQH